MYNEQYWKEKKERELLKNAKIKRINIFNRLMNMWFTPAEEVKARKHTRSLKERLVRRQKHRDRIRELT